MAGINAVLKIREQEPLVLDRSQAYIGVLIDDLITKDAREPYRIFTSRAEYRLLLRHGNADLRLMDIGHGLGLIAQDSYDRFLQKRASISHEINRLQTMKPKITGEARSRLNWSHIDNNQPPQSLAQLLRRQDSSYRNLLDGLNIDRLDDEEIIDEVELEIKYEGYIRRQLQQVGQFKKLEQRAIPHTFDYKSIHGFSREVYEKLTKIRPSTIGQASRISGITPAAVSLLIVALEKFKKQSLR